MAIARGVFYCPWRYLDVEAEADYLADKYVNTISFQRVGNGWHGEFYYPSKIAPHAYKGKRDLVDEAVNAFHKRDISFRAHVVVGNDAAVAAVHPDWLAKRADSVLAKPGSAFKETGYHHLCPNNPGYRERLYAVIDEIVRNYPIDGIDMDYIRYPYTPDGFFCYCDYCRTSFRDAHQLDSTELQPDTPEWATWIEWRAQKITELVQGIEQTMERARSSGPRPSLMLYIAPWWSQTSDRGEVERIKERFGQDLPKLSPHTNAFAPMLYHHYTTDPSFVIDQSTGWVGAMTRWIKDASPTPVWVTTQVMAISPREARVAVEVAFNGGADGVLLFPYGSIGSTCGDDTWQEIKKTFCSLAKLD